MTHHDPDRPHPDEPRFTDSRSGNSFVGLSLGAAFILLLLLGAMFWASGPQQTATRTPADSNMTLPQLPSPHQAAPSRPNG